ncbi:hypothetical protein GCM10027028_61290 [Streptomyces sundarbansensis]
MALSGRSARVCGYITATMGTVTGALQKTMLRNRWPSLGLHGPGGWEQCVIAPVPPARELLPACSPHRRMTCLRVL